MFGAVESGKESAAVFYNSWVDSVVASIPPDRLLLYNVRQGWAPLCAFLGVPEPEIPFPKLNDTKTVQISKQQLVIISYCFVIGVPIFLLVALSFILYYLLG